MAGKTVDILKYIIGIDTKDLQKGAKQAEKTVQGMSSSIVGSLKNIALGFGAYLGGRQLLGFIKNITLVAARNKELQIVLENVGRVAGRTAGFLAQEEEKIKALGITTAASRTLLIRFMQSQLDVADAAKVARAAQDLAVIAQQDSSEAAETLTYAIAAQRPILLRQYGIVTDLSEVFGKQAKALGKSAEELTEYEKRMAFLNVVMEQAARVSGTYEAAMTTAGKQARSLSRYVEEASAAMGKYFQPAFAVGAQTLTQFFKGLQNLFDPLGVMVSHQIKLAKYVDDTEEGIDALIDRYVELSEKGVLVNEEQAEMNGLMVKLLSLLPTVRTEYDAFGKVVALHVDSLRRAAEQFKAMYEAEKKALELELPIKMRETQQTIDDTETSLNALLQVVENQPESYDRWGSAITGLRLRLTKLREALIEYQQQLKMVRGTEEAGVGGDGATTEDGLKELSDAELEQHMWRLNLERKYNKISLDGYLQRLKSMIAAGKLNAEQETAIRRLVAETEHEIDKQRLANFESGLADWNKTYKDWLEKRTEDVRAIEENRHDWMYEQGEIELGEYIAFLDRRLAEYERFSSEWMLIFGRIQDIKREAGEAEKEEWEKKHAFELSMYESIGNAAARTFSDIFTSGKNLSDALKDGWKSFMDSVVNILADMLAKFIYTSLAELARHTATEKAKTAVTAVEAAKRAAISTGGPFALPLLFFQKGGLVGMQSGGFVEGVRRMQDNILTALSAGEFVIRRPAVDAIGRRNLEQMNRTGRVPSQSTNVINVEMGGMSFSRMNKTDSFFIGTSVTDQMTEIIKEALRQGKLEL